MDVCASCGNGWWIKYVDGYPLCSRCRKELNQGNISLAELLGNVVTAFDWISPTIAGVDAALKGAGKVAEFISNKNSTTYRNSEEPSPRVWTEIPCLVNKRSCRGKSSCSYCQKCPDHCSCKEPIQPIANISDQKPIKLGWGEWQCKYCGKANPKRHRQCDSCNGLRDHIY